MTCSGILSAVNWKSLFMSAAHHTGLSTLANVCWPNHIRTLCYHGVIAKRLQIWDHGFYTTVSEEEFREQLDWVGRHFQVVSCTQVRAHYLEGAPLPVNPVLITFDDGYWNNLAMAAPILREYGFPAVFFLSTGYIGTSGPFWFDDLPLRIMKWPAAQIQHPRGGAPLPLPRDPYERRELCRRIGGLCKRIPNSARLAYVDYIRRETAEVDLPFDEDMLRILNWDEVRELVRQGFEIGSHTCTHPILSRLEEDEIGRELNDSRTRIEATLGSSCFALAYPNGTVADYDDRVRKRAEAAGFDLAFTMADRPHGAREDRFTISRLGVPGHVSIPAFTFCVSGAHALARKLVHA